MKLLLFFAIALVSFPAIFAKETITATGRLTCNGKAIANSKITLRDDDLVKDEKMATGYTDANGNFRITGSGGDIAIRKKKRRPDPFVKPEYSASGSFGALSVGPTINLLRKTDKTKTLDDRKGTVSYGTVNFNSDECKAYLEFLKAMKDYKKDVGLKIPGRTLKVQTRVILQAGAPYAAYRTFRFPKNTKIDQETARHEMAHVVRHTYDGTAAHFLKDVGLFVYIRNHSCKKRTNNGFAFNEGWAEFYAGSCSSVTGSATDYKVEGNVAIALRKLKFDCGSSMFKMVNASIKNKGKIHSFAEYRKAHKALYGCPTIAV